MTDVRVRNLEAWVVNSLRTRARANGRSLEGELRELLRQEALRPKEELAEELRHMRRTAGEARHPLRLHGGHPQDAGRAGMIVLDASVAVKAYLEESGSDEAIALLAGQRNCWPPS